jgi:hypothetical protein
MARCEGTTKSGDQCKLDARPGSQFCHMHGPGEEEDTPEGNEDAMEFEDFVPLLLAGVMAAGFMLFLKSFGRWIPKF